MSRYSQNLMKKLFNLVVNWASISFFLQWWPPLRGVSWHSSPPSTWPHPSSNTFLGSRSHCAISSPLPCSSPLLEVQRVSHTVVLTRPQWLTMGTFSCDNDMDQNYFFLVVIFIVSKKNVFRAFLILLGPSTMKIAQIKFFFNKKKIKKIEIHIFT